MPNTEKQSQPEPKRFNVNDPTQTNRYQSTNYADFYTNRIELVISEEDVKFLFVHILGIKNDQVQLKEQCSITMSFHQARRIRDMLNRNISDDDPKFKLIEDYSFDK